MNNSLSICIPIYNCGDFIKDALDSILPQTKKEIEVILYDGGSTDNTSTLIDDYLRKWPNVHYHRGNVRGGIDADLIKCVGFAKSDYCWLFSGDDVMRPDAIESALTWINQKHDVYICKHTICNKSMTISHEHPVLEPDKSFYANFKDPTERIMWFERAVTSEAFFSFISSLIIRRDKWLSGQLHDDFSSSCWGHAARLFGVASTDLKVCYVNQIWLDQRGDNDSFADRGVVNRFRIGIEGYHNIANYFFGSDSVEAFHIRRVIRNEFKLQSFLSAKIHTVRNPDKESRPLLDQLINLAYGDKSLKNSMVILLYKIFPYSIFLVARYFYRCYKKLITRVKNV